MAIALVEECSEFPAPRRHHCLTWYPNSKTMLFTNCRKCLVRRKIVQHPTAHKEIQCSNAYTPPCTLHSRYIVALRRTTGGNSYLLSRRHPTYRDNARNAIPSHAWETGTVADRKISASLILVDVPTPQPTSPAQLVKICNSRVELER